MRKIQLAVACLLIRMSWWSLQIGSNIYYILRLKLIDDFHFGLRRSSATPTLHEGQTEFHDNFKK